MATNLSLYNLTSQQKSFLDALAGEAKGDYHKAKELAGYAPTTAMADIIRPIREHIAALTKEVLLQTGLKAAHAFGEIIDNPSMVGAANKVKAASEVLDRIGVVKPEGNAHEVAKGAIFILPPKNIKAISIDDGKITVDMTDPDNPQLIDIDAVVNEDESP